MSMADALFPLNIPEGAWQAVATEIDNSENPGAWDQLAARFGELLAAGRCLPINVSSAEGPVGAVKVAEDVEPGALSAADAAQAVVASPGDPVVIYCNRTTLPAVEKALGRLWMAPGDWPEPGPYLWDADWTGTPHVNPGSIATQWTSGAYDQSIISPAAPTFPSTVVKPLPSPPEVPDVTPEQLASELSAFFSPPNGEGWGRMIQAFNQAAKENGWAPSAGAPSGEAANEPSGTVGGS